MWSRDTQTPTGEVKSFLRFDGGRSIKSRAAVPKRQVASNSAKAIAVARTNCRADGSLIITSQFPIDRCHNMIGFPILADAISYRIIHNAYRIELAGESLRKTCLSS
jgi:hypothetical protein